MDEGLPKPFSTVEFITSDGKQRRGCFWLEDEVDCCWFEDEKQKGLNATEGYLPEEILRWRYTNGVSTPRRETFLIKIFKALVSLLD